MLPVVTAVVRYVIKDIENAILYDDLKTLLEIYGMPKSQDEIQEEESELQTSPEQQTRMLETVPENEQSA